MDWQSTLAAVGVSIAGVALSQWRAGAIVETKLAALEKDQTEIAADLKAATDELRKATMEFKIVAAEQSVLNKVASQTLDSIVNKQEQTASKVAEHSATITLMGELLKSGKH